MTKLRKGRTKSLLQSSLDVALLAVEVYNKPRTTFRSEAYITLMVIAWTRLFHAYFNYTIGDRYYYKTDNGRYDKVDGERKAWDLTTCIIKSGALSAPVKSNLHFFIKLRNKIEHRHIHNREVDGVIFGECQSLLFNFENSLLNFFGEAYCLNESLVYSLQFSHLRTHGQSKACKTALSKELKDLQSFVYNYRYSLSDDVFDSQEYSIKLIQIPKISNTNRGDAAIEFVRWDELSEDEKAAYEQIVVFVKDKKSIVEAANVERLKPTEVVKTVNQLFSGFNVSVNLHCDLYFLFKIRPMNGASNPSDTVTKYCVYDRTHNDYVYEKQWVSFLVHFLQTSGLNPQQLRLMRRKKEHLALRDFEI